MTRSIRQQGRPRRGTVLIVAMWIVLVLAGLTLVFARSMRVELAASENHVAALRAQAAARGALHYVLALVDGTDGLFDPGAETDFEAIQVGEDYFWILNPPLGDDVGLTRFGIRDEASRLNLNSATEDMLLKVPEMTSELAGAILDWRDPEGQGTGGAGNEYYLLLEDPYYCKSAPFETVEEILLVKGATPELLYGNDLNFNGVLDPHENGDGRLDRGMFPYFTAFSREFNLNRDGEERLDVNNRDTSALAEVLRPVVEGDRFFQIMDIARRGQPFSNLMDFHFRTGLRAEEFAQVADLLTTRRERNITGLVNVNTAPREVLLCLPGLEEGDVEALVSRRASPDADLSNIAWVAEALPAEKAVPIGDYITARSFQFTADLVAASGDGRAFRRYRAVVDARRGRPRVLAWKDLTGLGWPLEVEILATLRAGEPLDSAARFTVSGGF